MKKKNIILGAVLAVVGLLMAIMPATCIKAVVVLVGLAAAAIGIYNLFTTYKTVENPELKKTILIKSIISIIIGVVAVVFPFALLKTVTSIWKIISFILGVYLVLYAIFGFYSAVKLKDASAEDKKKNIKESFTSLLVAVLLFIIPIETVGTTFVRIIGIAGLVIGVFLVILEVVISKRTTVAKAEDVTVSDDTTDTSSENDTNDTTEEKTE